MTRRTAALAWLAVGFAAGIAAALVYWRLMHAGPIDDAYIHLRVAKHWAEGAGPVFNLGERVEVSTSPLWLALLTLGFRLGADGASWAMGLSILSAGVASSGVTHLAAALGGNRAAVLGGVLFALLPAVGSWAVTGMESTLACAFVVWTAGLAVEATSPRAVVVTGLLAAFAALVRPEAATLILPMVGVAIIGVESRHRVASAGLALGSAALVVGTVLLWRFVEFGVLVPNTYVAKVAGVPLFERLSHGASYVGHLYWLHAPVVVLALWAAWRKPLLGIEPLSGKAPIVVGLALVFIAGAAWTGGDHFPYGRLAIPALPLLVAVAAARGTSMVGWRGTLAIGVLLATLPWSRYGFFPSDELRAQSKLFSFVRNCEEVGDVVRSLPPGTLATLSIGAIGYADVDRSILDLVGLADPVIARSPRLAGAVSGHDHADTDYVLRRAPSFVLAHSWISEHAVDDDEERRNLASSRESYRAAELLVLEPRFRTGYVPMDLPTRSGRHVRLWKRRDVVVPLP